MRRSRGVSGLAWVAAGLVAATGAASAAAAPKPPASKPKVTTTSVAVTMSSSASPFAFSKTELIPAGAVSFRVTNSGSSSQAFEICLSPAGATLLDHCDGTGRLTQSLASGQSQTLSVTLPKNGLYEYLGIPAGQTSPVVTGLIGVGVKVKTLPPAAPVSTATPTSAPPTDPAGLAEWLCAIHSCDADSP